MNKKIILIALTILLESIGYGLILPVLPFIIQDLGYSPVYTGFVISMYFLGIFVGGYFLGKLSDNIGRNKTLLIIILFSITGYSLFSIGGSLYILLLSRFLGGLGASSRAVAQSYIIDFSSKKDRTKNIGYVRATLGMGFIIGPLLGAWLIPLLGLEVVGLTAVILSIINFFSVWFFLPDVKQKKEKAVRIIGTKKTILKNPLILALFIITLFTALGSSTYQSLLPIVVNDKYGYGPTEVGYLFGLIGFVSVIYQLFILKYIQNKFHIIDITLFGIFCFFLPLFLLAIGISYTLMFFAATIFALGYGTVAPCNSSMLGSIAKDQVGKVLGTNSSITGLGNAVGSFLAGYFYTIDKESPYFASSLLFLLSFLLLLLYINKKRDLFRVE